MTWGETLAVLAAGLGSGIVVSTVGVASLISFPVLLAIGLPPVVANASNTVGLAPAGLSGSFGYREELREHPRVTLAVLGTCSIGAVAGAALLLTMPPGVFEAVVPWLILLACLAVGGQPLLARWLDRQRDDSPDKVLTPATAAWSTLTGVYAGYFGAGAGVMMIAVMAIGLDLDLRLATALKTLSILVCSVVAGIVFVVAGELDWHVIGLLWSGGVVGGYVGARVGRRLPETLLRVLVVISGVVAFVSLV
ncbi:sulfite exporter TauE/SafE family protein [Nocardioides bigeumensis]|uniref:Probable membrane transporter protein n=1 Tax=Nocardioides bigeumensis TaxID=433657 RepID=A0ABP5JQC4_9ACTN